MDTTIFPRVALPLLAPIWEWWRQLEHAGRLAGGVSIAVVCATVYAGSVVGSYIEELFGHKAAASTALYMDSFIEPLVQELAVGSSLSVKNREALERLFSPTAIGKPVVAFRIWVGDRIVFSSHKEIMGIEFVSTPARSRAYQGEVVAKFGLDGDDDDAERALNAPILEVYAPIRQTSTNSIIALAETSELAVDLMKEVRAAQYTSYAVIGSMAGSLLLLLFNLKGRLQSRIGELSLQQAEDEQVRKRLCRANSRVFESNERNLQRLSKEMQSGPLQHVAFALLRLDALRETPDRLDQEVDEISRALKKCATQIRRVSAGLVPAQLEKMSLAEVIGIASSLHEMRTATQTTCDFRDLAHEAPYALKTCVYQFVEHGLKSASECINNAHAHVFAKQDLQTLLVELVFDAEGSKPLLWLTENLETVTADLRHRIELLGGTLAIRSTRNYQLSMTATFRIGDMEIANG